MHIGVGFQHTILVQTWPNVWIFGVLWCDGWARFVEMHASRWEVLDVVIREIWSLNLPKLGHNQLAMNCLFNLSFNHLCESPKLSFIPTRKQPKEGDKRSTLTCQWQGKGQTWLLNQCCHDLGLCNDYVEWCGEYSKNVVQTNTHKIIHTRKWVKMHLKEPQTLLYIGPACPFSPKYFFQKNDFLNDCFCNLLWKMTWIAPISQKKILIIF
jgi:hypothetical protein